jgi:hypothetical protein
MKTIVTPKLLPSEMNGDPRNFRHNRNRIIGFQHEICLDISDDDDDDEIEENHDIENCENRTNSRTTSTLPKRIKCHRVTQNITIMTWMGLVLILFVIGCCTLRMEEQKRRHRRQPLSNLPTTNHSAPPPSSIILMSQSYPYQQNGNNCITMMNASFYSLSSKIKTIIMKMRENFLARFQNTVHIVFYHPTQAQHSQQYAEPVENVLPQQSMPIWQYDNTPVSEVSFPVAISVENVEKESIPRLGDSRDDQGLYSNFPSADDDNHIDPIQLMGHDDDWYSSSSNEIWNQEEKEDDDQQTSSSLKSRQLLQPIMDDSILPSEAIAADRFYMPSTQHDNMHPLPLYWMDDDDNYLFDQNEDVTNDTENFDRIGGSTPMTHTASYIYMDDDDNNIDNEIMEPFVVVNASSSSSLYKSLLLLGGAHTMPKGEKSDHPENDKIVPPVDETTMIESDDDWIEDVTREDAAILEFFQSSLQQE